MRHKNIIIALAALLCVLLVIKAVVNHKENTTYPLQLDWSAVYGNSSYTSSPKIVLQLRIGLIMNVRILCFPRFRCEIGDVES